MTEHKEMTGYLRIDWKKGKISARKTRPKTSKLGANELLAPVTINVEIPEVDQPGLELDMTVPEARVTATEFDQIDEDDRPGWTGVADEKVADRESALRRFETVHDIEQEVERITARTLLDAPGMAKPDHVETYVHEQVMALLEADDAE